MISIRLDRNTRQIELLMFDSTTLNHLIVSNFPLFLKPFNRVQTINRNT